MIGLLVFVYQYAVAGASLALSIESTFWLVSLKAMIVLGLALHYGDLGLQAKGKDVALTHKFIREALSVVAHIMALCLLAHAHTGACNGEITLTLYLAIFWMAKNAIVTHAHWQNYFMTVIFMQQYTASLVAHLMDTMTGGLKVSRLAREKSAKDRCVDMLMGKV